MIVTASPAFLPMEQALCPELVAAGISRRLVYTSSKTEPLKHKPMLKMQDERMYADISIFLAVDTHPNPNPLEGEHVRLMPRPCTHVHVRISLCIVNLRTWIAQPRGGSTHIWELL
jgi:hypothetical protein